MMKIYRLTKYNRFDGYRTEEFYVTKERAEEEQAKIAKIYDEAEAKGMGGHWGTVVWERDAYIEEIEVIE